MDTRNHIDIDRHIKEMQAELRRAVGAEERHRTAAALAKLVAEPDLMLAELRASRDWNDPPFYVSGSIVRMRGETSIAPREQDR